MKNLTLDIKHFSEELTRIALQSWTGSTLEYTSKDNSANFLNACSRIEEFILRLNTNPHSRCVIDNCNKRVNTYLNKLAVCEDHIPRVAHLIWGEKKCDSENIKK